MKVIFLLLERLAIPVCSQLEPPQPLVNPDGVTPAPLVSAPELDAKLPFVIPGANGPMNAVLV